MWNNVLTHIVKYLTSFDVKWNSPLYICEANISQRSYFTWRSHISLAEGEFRWKKKSKSFRLAFFFLAPRTGLEPVTSWLTVMRSTDWATEEYCVGLALSSRTASSRVFSAPHSLTSVFGMGTGGPCALWRPTELNPKGILCGAPSGIRTLDPLIKSQLLYQLS